MRADLVRRVMGVSLSGADRLTEVARACRPFQVIARQRLTIRGLWPHSEFIPDACHSKDEAGAFGFGSILRRSRATSMSMLRSSDPAPCPTMAWRSWSRDSTRQGLPINAASNADSPRVSCTSRPLPSTKTWAGQVKLAVPDS